LSLPVKVASGALDTDALAKPGGLTPELADNSFNRFVEEAMK
jgi:hypothetical protein